jgi:peptidoglycan/LPS O-acetylase OafA/YrhL
MPYKFDYRPEVDGLRALAVVPVILFHAGFGTFSGGYVGVDVFFVISGYLITTIILSEIEQGTFSLVNFYERRARRILPALFLVMFISLPFAWFWLLPSDMKDFSQSLVAVSVFASNILFWQETGYWGVENEFKPLLHTWSLAVEEQYYVLYPLFLIAMYQFRRRWILVSLLIITGTSLLIAQWGAYKHPVANFFLLPTRGWELAIGASIAFYFLYRKKTIRNILSYKVVNETLGLVGLMMIAYAVFAFDETVPFPSLYAVIPTIGTGLIIIFSSSQTIVGQFLGTKLLVGIGLISYSAYLWHQPLYAFARHRSLVEPSEFFYSALAAMSFILAYLSWRYMEKIFKKKEVLNRTTIFTFAVAGSVVFSAIGLAGHITDGFEGRFSTKGTTQQRIDETIRINYGLSDACDNLLTLSLDCRTSDEPEILVWGDSYAMQLVQGIMASNPEAKIIQMTKLVCGPFFDLSPVVEPNYSPSWAKGCLEFNGDVREWLTKNDTVRYAVLSSNITNYLSSDLLLLRNGDRKNTDTDLLVRELIETLNELNLMGITPIHFSAVPANGNNIGRCLTRAEWYGVNLDSCNFKLDALTQGLLDEYALLEIINKYYPVVRLDRLICDDTSCPTHIGSVLLYRDKGHLSIEGSAELGKKLDFYGLIVSH